MAEGMDLLFCGLGGDYGFYGTGPCGTPLHEASHGGAPGTSVAERVVPGHTTSPLLGPYNVLAGRDLESMEEPLIYQGQ